MTRRLSPTAIGRWSTRHPWRAIALWLVFVVAAVAASGATGSKQLQNGAVGQSGRGYALMQGHGVGGYQSEYGYLHSDSLRAGDSAFRAAIADVATRMRDQLGGVPQVRHSRDGHSVLVVVRIDHGFSIGRLRASVLAAGAAHPGIHVDESGEVSASGSVNQSGDRDLHRAELLSVPVALIVLLLAFGSVVAALVPVLLALTVVIAAFGLLGPISQAFPLDSSVKTILVLIGMAVGVDYALFYVVRSREERRRGVPSHEALERTARTSGRTVLIAGATVATAMAGQYAIGSEIFNGISSATIAVVACAVVGSLTVLPGLLELLGPRIDRGRIPVLPDLGTDPAKGRFWPAVIGRILRRPLVCGIAAGALLVALAVPALGMHVAKPSDQSLSSQNSRAAVTLARIRAEFPSTSAAAELVVTVPPNERAALTDAVRRLERLAAARGIAHPPFMVTPSADGQAALVDVPLTGAGDNPTSRQAIPTLRNELIPQTIGRLPGVQTALTGDTAEDVDFTNQMKHGLPYVIAFVLILAFVLLLIAFRSIVVPLKAIALNLLSVAASYGVLVLVFQHHWAEGLLGFHSNGAIISWLPLFLFVVLFGLSMDYHLFILSRVREAVDDGMSTEDALHYGIARTAGVVTSAALVMVGVFSLFATLSSLDLKQAGVGLASAIVIDATIVRAVLLPASMKLLGERNWYLPRWLAWLPRTNLEAPRRPKSPVAVPVAATE